MVISYWDCLSNSKYIYIYIFIKRSACMIPESYLKWCVYKIWRKWCDIILTAKKLLGSLIKASKLDGYRVRLQSFVLVLTLFVMFMSYLLHTHAGIRSFIHWVRSLSHLVGRYQVLIFRNCWSAVLSCNM